MPSMGGSKPSVLQQEGAERGLWCGQSSRSIDVLSSRGRFAPRAGAPRRRPSGVLPPLTHEGRSGGRPAGPSPALGY
jgi:hypothetical protein